MELMTVPASVWVVVANGLVQFAAISHTRAVEAAEERGLVGECSYHMVPFEFVEAGGISWR